MTEEYGPEWWAMGQEYCQCEHHYDEHSPEDGHCYECRDCPKFIALDAQSALDVESATGRLRDEK